MFEIISTSEQWIRQWVEWPAYLEIFFFYTLFIYLLRLWWVKLWSHFGDLSEVAYKISTKKLADWGLLKELIWLIKFYHAVFKNILKVFQSRIYFQKKYNFDSQTGTYLAQSTWDIIYYNVKTLLFNVVTFSSAVITTCIIWNISLTLIWQDTLNFISNTRLDVVWNEYISKMPALLAVLGMIFIFIYLNGTKGFIRRAVASANRKKLEEVINEHREIVYGIATSLPIAFDNLDYVMLNRRGLARAWVHRTYEDNINLQPLLNKYYKKSIYNIDRYMMELHNTEGLQTINSKFQSNRALYYGQEMRYFIHFSSLLRGYHLLRPYRGSLNRLETYFFTPKGLEILYQAKPQNILYITNIENYKENELIEALRKDEEFMYELILEAIVNSLEAQFALLQYVDSASRILHMNSDYMGRNIRSLFNKDSW
ncbi:hypothetical protein [Brevibacillus sp. DP1.3A]|uniref:hypothetical protein n=1 Tax=Brevibacillus sp. DP1.3A TaxID=2738867 RepID=UPI00156ACD75|nr:hypothetical protein [Brevibacillus sp. DP1.3A]UED74781.1 hypothetical protein HP399_029535 [Brevibacillus sp. DP1.3A]